MAYIHTKTTTTIRGGLLRRLWMIVVCVVGSTWGVQGQINTPRVMSMGRSALFYEDYVVALQYFNMCVNAKPYVGEGYYYRALSKFYLGDYTGANVDATKALELNPYIPNLLPLRAISRVKLRLFREAEADYEAIVMKAPRDVSSWNNLVMCQIEDSAYNKADSTILAMRKTVKDRKAADELQHVVAEARKGIRPAFFSNQKLSEGFATSEGQDEDMLIQPLYALNFYPSTSITPSYEAFYAPIEQVNHMGIFPMPLHITNNEGYVSEAAIKRHEVDIESTTSRLAALPESSLLYLRRAMDYYTTLQFEQAITDLDNSIRLDTANYMAHFLRAQSRLALQMTIQGGQPLSNVSTDALLAYGNVVDDLKRTIQLEPQFVYAYYNLGTTYMLIHDYDKAEILLSKAIAMDGHLPAAYFNRGITRIKNNRKSDAMLDLSQAAQNGIYTAYNVIKKLEAK